MSQHRTLGPSLSPAAPSLHFVVDPGGCRLCCRKEFGVWGECAQPL